MSDDDEVQPSKKTPVRGNNVTTSSETTTKPIKLYDSDDDEQKPIKKTPARGTKMTATTPRPPLTRTADTTTKPIKLYDVKKVQPASRTSLPLLPPGVVVTNMPRPVPPLSLRKYALTPRKALAAARPIGELSFLEATSLPSGRHGDISTTFCIADVERQPHSGDGGGSPNRRGPPNYILAVHVYGDQPEEWVAATGTLQ